MLDLFIEIFESIRRNKLRTCLTGCAVSWGIFMLIVLLGAGNGIMNVTNLNASEVASNDMTVYGGYTSKPYNGLSEGRYLGLEESDVALTEGPLFEDIVEDASAVVSVNGMQASYGKRSFSVYAMGTYPDFDVIRSMKMLSGRYINRFDMELNRKVVVIGHKMAESMLGGNADYRRMMGKKVKLGDILFTVVGIMKTEENNNDENLYMPYTTLKRIYGKDKKIDLLMFTFHGISSKEESEDFERRYKTVMNRVHGAAPDDNVFYISNSFTQNMQIEKAKNILEIFLWVIGFLTLLSGIVGVSNIMLITVKERVHEFGIRKSIGASPWGIMSLIITESVVITSVFGFLGMFFGLVGCEVLDATVGSSTMSLFGYSFQIMKNPTVGIGVALEATALLVVSGTVAGLIPALKAARVKPIEALSSR